MNQPTIFQLPDDWMASVNVLVIGAGGTGSEVLDGLTRLHLSLLALGHPNGLQVTVFDDDIVEAHNIPRQRFSEYEIGEYKSLSLINRINHFYGLAWKAFPYRVDIHEEDTAEFLSEYDLIIGCTDSGLFRKDLHEMAQYHQGEINNYWLDFGNGSFDGQCVLGNLYWDGVSDYLPNVVDLYPDIDIEEEQAPSCSAQESLRRQSAFINPTIARTGLSLLYNLFVDGKIEQHGFHLNLKTLKTSPIAINPDTWAFYGFSPQKLA